MMINDDEWWPMMLYKSVVNCEPFNACVQKSSKSFDFLTSLGYFSKVNLSLASMNGFGRKLDSKNSALWYKKLGIIKQPKINT